MILKWFLVEGGLLQISASPLVPGNSVGGVTLAEYLRHLGGVLWHDPIWYVWVVIRTVLC
jgi:hypothetical protein